MRVKQLCERSVMGRTLRRHRTLCHPLNVPGDKARFVEPMLLLRTDNLPEGPGWQYEVFLRISADQHKSLSTHGSSMGRCLIEARRLLTSIVSFGWRLDLNAAHAQRLHRHREFEDTSAKTGSA